MCPVRCADGMVRAIGNKHVLLNNYIDYDKNLRMEILERLTREGFEVEELHYDMPRPSRYSWAYLNFLQVRNRIFVPGLGLEEDEKVLEQIKAIFPSYRVVMVPYAPRNRLKISYLRHLRINFTILPYTLIAFCLLPPQSRKCRPGDSADGNDMLDGL